MSEKKRAPLLRLEYRDRNTKERYECGAVWPPQQSFKGLAGNFQPVTETDLGRRKMALIDALQGFMQGDGWLNVQITRAGAIESRRWALDAEPPQRDAPPTSRRRAHYLDEDSMPGWPSDEDQF